MTMTPERRRRVLSQWDERMRALDAQIDALSATLGLHPEGGLLQLIDDLAEAYTEAVAECCGDTEGWLGWYRYDNDHGRRELTAGRGDALTPIRSTDQLAGMIEAGLPCAEVQS